LKETLFPDFIALSPNKAAYFKDQHDCPGLPEKEIKPQHHILALFLLLCSKIFDYYLK
jgi:hypothetical protein